ncbi:type VI secretion system membrane subunit TssM [Burkholderia pseudomallei]|uniref:type VI secretion system membrane subunit TssM n=1 Tax=Burkholderia pseudomallei TaxID=28450 RepID=UPI0002EB7760|nr:type VI secretion system membrane subunit TssM [Burkholderia pseudomallei]AGR71439.1 intracellular multiplication and macrophage-killing family protein [Burkholderia pseudomallei MSHR305]AHK64756.1 intracellular multiplication and macrophage-killing family protein [Burkholderia pseudomallei MSHR520]AIP79157.1 intracellular multiplication and macrophage-killing family protein [Burkholderia pseudomallei]APZ18775.1 type VI secretion protein VasK [Burkholderia pseudomallei]APZ24970.1 type VI se
MQRFLNVLTHPRTLTIVGFAALAAVLFIAADALQIGLVWAAVALGVALALWLATKLWRRWRVRRANRQLGDMLEQQAETGKMSAAVAEPAKRAELDVLRTRLADTVKTIKTSKIGQVSGGSALYELPWYIVIGNPAAGKSSAVINSGLQFPFADKNSAVIHGIGGTRNCDWFFTTEGILLDTAGRYSVHEEDRSEWLGFLDLLKRYRPKAPINGIIVTASIAELTGNRPEFAINLAKNLRQRVQELTEKLEVFAPVYVMFTKADLITGFTEFFSSNDRQEYDRVWGATLPYEPDEKRDVVALFDQRFEELYDGLKEISVAQLSVSRGNKLSPGQLSFPLEFSTIKPALRSFLATLFEDNPFQYKPIFRGFYFTSALQEGETNSAAAQRIAHRFGLDSQSLPKPHSAFLKNGFFLRDLFSKVIFADRQTVRQFASPTKTRMRYATFFGFVAALALALGGWTWSTIGNQQLVSNVQADLDNVTRLQQNRNDLQSRLQAMDILEDRIEQLEQFRRDKPLSVSLGLYQGNRLEQHLLTEYYNGVRQILLAPVSDNLASFLKDVNAHPDQLAPMTRAPESGATPAGPMPVSTHPAAPGAAPSPAVAQGRQQGGLYNDASPTNVEDAYNALKTYLMLSDKRHVEQAHLTDQVARFWRGWLETNRGNMPRDEMIRSAERMITFYLSRVSDNDWPMIEANLALVDQTRENLRRVVRGMPARQRVYEEIKARASTRFAPMTIARIVGEGNTGLVAGSYAIPGTFTRDAWFQYVQPAIRDAATKELQAKDWVLNTASADDLTLEGSPEQIQKTLVAMYKTEYAQHWQKFMQGIAVQGFGNFTQAVDAMNKLGDPQDSPIRKVLETAYDQTSWDNPSLANATIKKAQTGVVNWVKQWFTRQPGGQIAANVDINGNPADVPMGPIGQEFVGLGRIVATHDGTSMLKGYMDTLSKVRTRFNVIKNQGDPGPGARQLMQQTLDGNGSELADSLKFVDEQMLTGLTDSQRKSLRPLLVRPLMQAFAVVIQPASVEVNKVWNAQVYQPFQNSLANKYPFAAGAKVEAGAGEIAQVFGPDGSIAKFVGTTLGPLAVRRGDTLSARTWGDMGLALTPDFTGGFARWVAPLAGGAATSAAASSEPQTVFQVLPQPSSGTTEYTIAIDGQQLRYRNTPPQWTNFVWPNPQGSPGATLSATTFDGRTLQLVNEPGRYGLEKLINSAQRKRRPDGTFDLTWTQGSVSVSVTMRIISTSQPTGGGDQPQQQSLRGLRLPSSVADASAGGAANATAQPGSGAAAAQVAATAASASNAQGAQ